MYVSVRNAPEALGAAPEVARSSGLPARVWLLGLTSLLTDVSSEMVTSTLPIFLTAALGLTPLQFGFIDGLQQGASGILRILGGAAADRGRRHKGVATTGYALSAACKAALIVVVRSYGWLAATLVVDRVGKSLRTAPRDAMISMSVPTARLGWAFGVHRTLDATGAFLGPVVAFAVLAVTSERFESVFLVSACFAAAGVVVIGLLVRAPQARIARMALPPDERQVRWRAATTPALRRLAAASGLLAVATISDAFVLLVLRDRVELSVGMFPLLFVAVSGGYLLLAAPVGRLADRWGRARIYLAGYAVLLLAYVALGSGAGGGGVVVVALLAMSLHYAATDGVLAALTSQVSVVDARGTALGLVTTVVAGARLVGAVVFGALWTFAGSAVAVTAFAVALVAALVSASLLLRADRAADGGPA